MDLPKNTEDFDRCVAVVLAQLYEAFPQPKTIVVWEIQAADDPKRILLCYEDKMDQSEKVREEIENTLSTYQWTLEFLRSEGIVRDIEADRAQEIAKHVKTTTRLPKQAGLQRQLILTSRGLSLLNAVPKPLSGPEASLIDKFRSGLKNNSQETIRAAIVSFVANIATLPFL